MSQNWNGYLVKSLNRLACAYHLAKPKAQHSVKDAVAAESHRRRKSPAPRRRRPVVSVFGGLAIGLLAAVIARKFC